MRAAKALGPKGWMESCKKATERFQADMEKVTKEMMEKSGEERANGGVHRRPRDLPARPELPQ